MSAVEGWTGRLCIQTKWHKGFSLYPKKAPVSMQIVYRAWLHNRPAQTSLSWYCCHRSRHSQALSFIKCGWLLSYFIVWDSPSLIYCILCSPTETLLFCSSALFYLLTVRVEDYRFTWSHSVTYTKLRRTPMDDGLARNRDLHLITHKTRKRQTPMPWRDSNPQSQQVTGRRPAP